MVRRRMAYDPQLVQGGDPDLVEASRRAVESFRYFWRELFWERHRIVKGLELAAIKVPFSDDPNAGPDDADIEHMWINDVDFDGLNVSGHLINSPSWLKKWKVGDETTLPLGRISDWMYSLQGRVYGAYTVNVLRSRMNDAERAGHDDAWGLDFGDPSTPRNVPWDDEAAPHPMGENMVPKAREAMTASPEQVTMKNHRGWTLLHEHALAGSTSIVALLLELGADRFAQTPDGRTPADVADAGGWGELAARLRVS